MNNIIEEKSFDFAVRIVNLNKYLRSLKKEFVISNQIIKSATSIGANVSEAQYAQSNMDFISKISIARKETSETKYWLRLLYATDYINENEYLSLYQDAEEIHKILSSIILTAKQNANDE